MTRVSRASIDKVLKFCISQFCISWNYHFIQHSLLMSKGVSISFFLGCVRLPSNSKRDMKSFIENRQTDRRKNGQTDIWRDTETDRQTDRQRDRRRDRQRDRQRYRQRDRLTDQPTDRPTNKQARVGYIY